MAARQRRNDAWALRRKLWEISSLARVRACGRVSRTAGGPTLRLARVAPSCSRTPRGCGPASSPCVTALPQVQRAGWLSVKVSRGRN
jgi:hypothetical protein